MDDFEKILDELEIAEVERLLQGNLRLTIDSGARKRVAAAVLHQAGMRNRRWPSFKVVCFASISAMVLIGILLAFAGESVKATVNKVFSFIPGFAIVEDDPSSPSFRYYLAAPSSAENSDVKLVLRKAVASRDNITLTVNMEFRDKNLWSFNSDATLHVFRSLDGGKSLRDIRSYQQGSKGGGDMVSPDRWYQVEESSFTLRPEDIDANAVYRLEYPHYRLAVEFRLREFQSFDTLDQVGTTDVQNDISLTAVPSLREDILTVDIYAVNKSQYRIDGFVAMGGENSTACHGHRVHLETNNGSKPSMPSTRPDFSSPNQTAFTFKVSPQDKDFVLKIPCLQVHVPNEKRYVRVTIPPVGPKIPINETVDFGGSSMTIVDAEQRPAVPHDRQIPTPRRLIMNVKFENRLPQKKMMSYSFPYRTDSSGDLRPINGGWGPGQNEESAIVHISLKDDDQGTLPLVFHEPAYYLLGEYSLKLDRYLQKVETPAR